MDKKDELPPEVKAEPAKSAKSAEPQEAPEFVPIEKRKLITIEEFLATSKTARQFSEKYIRRTFGIIYERERNAIVDDKEREKHRPYRAKPEKIEKLFLCFVDLTEGKKLPSMSEI